MNAQIILKATEEIIKLTPSENVKEDDYRENIMKSIKKFFNTNDDDLVEMIMYLAEWDSYVYEWKYVDFTILRCKSDNKIRVRASHNKCSNYVEFSTIYEIDWNEDLIHIRYQLEEIDWTYK